MWMPKVKKKVVHEYKQFTNNLKIGKPFDYTHILDMINFVEIGQSTNNPEMIANYFINKC